MKRGLLVTHDSWESIQLQTGPIICVRTKPLVRSLFKEVHTFSELVDDWRRVLIPFEGLVDQDGSDSRG